ncbi:MAG TPA: hypothetical protein VLC28_04375 [Flavitalea sp.]|nr:hypothetical protein [Flavitalea sp.]
MKKLLSIGLALITVASIHAQNNLASSSVPAATKAAFAKAHPNVNGKWEKEDGNYEVSFKENGKDMSCIIDKNGSIQETETEIPVSELPSPVTGYIAKHYKGIKVKEAAMIVKADGSIVYEAEIKGEDVLVDAKGNLVNKKKDND